MSTLKERMQSETKEEKKMKATPKNIEIYINNKIFYRFDSLFALLHDRYCNSVA